MVFWDTVLSVIAILDYQGLEAKCCSTSQVTVQATVRLGMHSQLVSF